MTVPRQAMRIDSYAGSDVGRVRKGNEDNFHAAGGTVFAVADGMGGHQAGEIASETALQPLAAIDRQSFDTAEAADDALARALEIANDHVVDKATAEPGYRGMGTTLTAVLVRGDHLHVAHVGDSRAYLLRGGEPISQLTTDHTLVERLVQEGRLSRDEAANHPQRNVITRAIGHESRVQVDRLPPLLLQPGDQVVLCSDGLTGPVSDEQLTEILDAHPDGDAAVDALIRAANDAGGPDNITVVLLRVLGADTASEEGAPAAVAVAAPSGKSTQRLLGAPDEEHLRRISTRTESGQQDWARQMGRLGAPQGVERRPRGADQRSGRGKRALAFLLAVLVLVAIIGGGGWFLLSRAFYVGPYDGRVAIYNGLPQQVAGVQLYWVMEDEISDLPMSELPSWQQARIREGLSAGTLGEARRIVDNLEASLEESAAQDPPGGSSDDDPDPSPNDTRDQ